VLTFCVSCDEAGEFEADVVRLIHGDTHPDGPGFKEEVVESGLSSRYPARSQRTESGSYVRIADGGELHLPDAFSLHAFVWPTLPSASPQGLITRWDESTQTGWALTLETGALRFKVGDANGVCAVASDMPLFREVWYSVSASYDPRAQQLSLRQRPVVNRVNSVFGPVVPLESSADVIADASHAPGDAGVPTLIGSVAESPPRGGRTWVVHNYSGKIDSPTIFGRVLSAEDAERLAVGERIARDDRLAEWDFSAGIGPGGIATDRVADVSGHRLDGECVNQPDRAMTGWNWTGDEEHFVHAPEQYGAIWFHEDSLDDCRWDSDFELTIPDALESGFYALRLRMGEFEDHVPFFVLPTRGTADAKILLLVPTLSYLAYGNQQGTQNADAAQAVAGHVPVLSERDFELHARPLEYGLSLYNQHVDGKGVQYASWRRPLLNMRPKHRNEFGGLWKLPADLHLVDWLHASGHAFDVATDHDLISQGPALLERYNVVLTGTHPEYYSGAMIDAWEDYLAGGGRGMYLGGNGLYWVTSQHPEKPWVIEVRRGEAGARAWQARPGEYFHSTSGERGGLWRNRARATQKIWGTGFTAHGFDCSAPFVQMPDTRSTQASWIMEGVEHDEPIGDFGLLGKGAAGYELDRYDRALGTPPHTLLLASSVEHTPNYTLAAEDIFFTHPGMAGGEHPGVRGDIVYFTTANGGAVFAASSIAWCGSLSHNDYDNNVSRIMNNVLSRFAQNEPLPALAEA
jgi:N,N-dimethylformamidase